MAIEYARGVTHVRGRSYNRIPINCQYPAESAIQPLLQGGEIFRVGGLALGGNVRLVAMEVFDVKRDRTVEAGDLEILEKSGYLQIYYQLHHYSNPLVR